MEYRSQDQLAQIANVYRDRVRTRKMSQQERLRRWVKLLDQQPDRVLRTLRETEYRPRKVRDAMRRDGTAIAIAFTDPVLRAEGLGGDSYGDARRFFGLSDRQLHLALCFCCGGPTMSSSTAARRLEAFIPYARGHRLLRSLMRALSA